METTKSSVSLSDVLSTVSNPSPLPTPSAPPTPAPDSATIPAAQSTRVSVEIPSHPGAFDPFSPNVIKFLEDVGPIAYLALLCLFIWLLTRFVEVVKGK